MRSSDHPLVFGRPLGHCTSFDAGGFAAHKPRKLALILAFLRQPLACETKPDKKGVLRPRLQVELPSEAPQTRMDIG